MLKNDNSAKVAVKRGTPPRKVFRAAFSKDNVAITLSANDTYVPYLATALVSIYQNISSNHNYDVIILSNQISERNQARMKKLVSGAPNFSLRFIEMSEHMDKFSNLFVTGHFTVETWLRLMLPELLSNYDKVLYLDADLVVNADLAELYQTDLRGNFLAACHDPDSAGLYNGFFEHKKNYIDNILKIKKPYDYFQAGVILFNLKKFRKELSLKKLLDFAGSYPWELLDQDVLNYFTQGKVKFVDMAWNVMFDWDNIRMEKIISLAPQDLQDEYQEARKNPKIVHFAGPDKPWHQPMADFAELFWKYAKESGFYEEIIYRNITRKIELEMQRREQAQLSYRCKAKLKRILRRIHA